jgi:hypothetical protein
MAKIPGRLIVDLFPDCMMRIVFLARFGGRNEIPLTAKDLDAAEDILKMCGLIPGEMAALRRTLTRKMVASVNTIVEKEVAAKFRHTRP